MNSLENNVKTNTYVLTNHQKENDFISYLDIYVPRRFYSLSITFIQYFVYINPLLSNNI